MKRLLIILLCLASLLNFSCAARINGSLAADGSAIINVNVSLEPHMSSLIRRLSAAGGQTGALVLDGPGISRSMSAAPGIGYVSLENTASAALEGNVVISQISRFLSAADGRGFIVFDQNGRVEINISRFNGPSVIELLSPEISNYLHALMAPIATGENLSKNEYLDLVTLFYNINVSNEIAASRIRASIDFPGTVTSVRGGTFAGRRAEFDIPLLDLLVLETPLSYEVRWD